MAADEIQNQYDLENVRIPYQRVREESIKQGQTAQPRMGWGIFLIALVLGLIADVAEFFTAGTLGWFVGFFIDLILLAMLGLSTAGRKQFKKWIWGPIVESVPVLSTVPFFRAGFLIWSFVSSRSTKLQTISQITSAGVLRK